MKTLDELGIKYKLKEDFISLKIEITESNEEGKTYYTGQIMEDGLTGCIVQGDSEEEVKRRLVVSCKALIDFYRSRNNRLEKVAIWNSNSSENQFWFRMLGIGLTINYFKNPLLKHLMKYGWEGFGITKQNGLSLWKFLIFPQNCWKNSKKK